MMRACSVPRPAMLAFKLRKDKSALSERKKNGVDSLADQRGLCFAHFPLNTHDAPDVDLTTNPAQHSDDYTTGECNRCNDHDTQKLQDKRDRECRKEKEHLIDPAVH